jgi:hypothetical protein
MWGLLPFSRDRQVVLEPGPPLRVPHYSHGGVAGCMQLGREAVSRILADVSHHGGIRNLPLMARGHVPDA